MTETARDWVTAGELHRSRAQPDTASTTTGHRADAHFLHSLDSTPERTGMMLALSDWSDSAQPDMQPILTVPTSWYTPSLQQLTVNALMDTGCGTSAITSQHLGKIIAETGQQITTFRLSRPTTLTSATNGVLTADLACSADFLIDGAPLQHIFHVFDHLPDDVILGMDFIVGKRLILDMSNKRVSTPAYDIAMQIYTLNNAPPRIPLRVLSDTTLAPGQSLHIPLSWLQHAQVSISQPLIKPFDTGFITPDIETDHPDLLVVWGGLTAATVADTVEALVTNFSEEEITLSARTLLAWWSSSDPQEIAMADKLRQIPPQPTTAQDHVVSCFSLSDYEWQDAHLSAPVDRVPLGIPDPPTEASLQQLRQFRSLVAEQLKQAAAPDAAADTADIAVLARQVDRVNERILQLEATSTQPQDLPPELSFEQSYGPLTPEEIANVKQGIMEEAGFFMKGKYPTVIKAKQQAKIDTGEAPPRSSGYRRLSDKEQAIVTEYVEKLIAADVVEKGRGPWSSPILLVPKKDGGLRAVADLRRVNECVLRDSYPMPDVHELLDQLAGAKWFTSLDLGSAFWQLPLAEESRDCTPFMTKSHGLLRWKALPMGFKNSSAYFQREIDAALGSLRLTCCVVYIDDICVYSSGSPPAKGEGGYASATRHWILWQPSEVRLRSKGSHLPRTPGR